MNIKYETVLNETLPETKALPYYNALPKDVIGLMKWRIYVRKRCLHDIEFRNAIIQACAADVAFFAATFAFFHETRETEKFLGAFPVVLDPDQADILALMQKYCGRIDIVIEKTRGVGLSFLACVYCIWLWLFKSQKIDIGLLSKDLTSLDIADRPSTLMGKLDCIFESLPGWLRLDTSGKTILHRTSSQNHRFENLVNGNCIMGFVPTDHKLRSARLYCLFADEAAFLEITDQRWLASAHGTTPSVCWISTHNGSGSLFFRLCNDESSDLIRISTFWWANRRCAAGMYKSEKGMIRYLDPVYKYPDKYEFSHEHAGKLRSPFVDRAFRRPGIDPQTVLEELYGIAAIQSRKIFRESLTKYLQSLCSPAVYRCDVVSDSLVENDDDPELYCWVYPTQFNGRYIIGVDPATGVGDGAYAAAVVIDVRTGIQVMSVALRDMTPIEFAQYVVSVAKILSGPRGSGFCKIAFESTGGVGAQFAGELNRLRWYGVCHDGTKSTPGFHNSDRGEGWLLELGRALLANELVIKDSRIVFELQAFEYNNKQELLYTDMDGHGDLAIAASLAWQGAKDARRAIMGQEKASKDIGRGVEAEIKYQDRRKMAGNYSSKFGLRGV